MINIKQSKFSKYETLHRELSLPLPFQVVPLCPGEIGLLANSWSSSSLPVLAIHDGKIDFFPLPPDVQGVNPAWKFKKYIYENKYYIEPRKRRRPSEQM